MAARVLVIDDSPEFVELMKVILEREKSHEVVGNCTGIISFEDLATCRPDLIILDLVLPETNGRDLLKELRDNRETADMPVLILSAATVELRLLARELKEMPHTAFLEKPFEIDDLLGTLDHLLDEPAVAQGACCAAGIYLG